MLRVGEGPRDVAIGGGAVWVANEFSGTDLADRPAARTTSVPHHDRQPADRARSRERRRLGDRPTGGRSTPRWNLQHRGGAGNPVDSLDPAIVMDRRDLADLELDGRRPDRLQTRRRLRTARGSFPTWRPTCRRRPTGGKTYTFQLRRGIRYSTGALVEPTDIRFALERGFEVGSPDRLLLEHRRRLGLQERTPLRPVPRHRRRRGHDRLPSRRARPRVSAEVGAAVRLRRSLLDAAPGRRQTSDHCPVQVRTRSSVTTPSGDSS